MGKSINTVGEIIRVHGIERAAQTALIQGERQMTWGQLLERSCRMAQALRSVGVGEQERVSFLDKNSIEHFEVFFGCSLLNAVAVDVNWRLAPPEVAYIVNDAESRVFIVHNDFRPVVEAIAADLRQDSLIVVIGGDGSPVGALRTLSYDDFMASGDPVDPGVGSVADDVAFQLYSSGTTGRPKGVMLSNNNFFALLPVAKEMWELGPDAINMVAMPLFHIGGGGWATAGMYEGCTSLIVRDLDPVAVVKMIPQYKVTHAFLVPAVLQFMLAVPDVDKNNFSSLKVFVYGASPISEEVLAKSVKTFGCRFWQAYGLTETTGAIVNLPPADHDPDGPNKHRLRSCGLPGPGAAVRVVDGATHDDMPVGEVGEIWLKSPQVMKGYWKMPEATAEAIVDGGWFRSGDAGYLDADGYLYIHDRVKDMIVSGGENVYPAEVENVLMSHPAIADVAVIGVPHEKWGETVKAMVVRAPGAVVTEQEIIDHAKERLAKFKCPTSVDWIEVLPRNPSGKVLKKDLRAPFWEGRSRNVN
jgi:long-chain acyl-CoA synthetase